VISCDKENGAARPPAPFLKERFFITPRLSWSPFEYLVLARSSSELDDGGEADTDVA